MRHTRRPTTTRHGFSLVEMLIVLVVGSIMMAISFPKLHDAFLNERVRSTHTLVQAYLASARSAAQQRGGPAVFYADNSTKSIRVTADSNGTQVSLRPRVRLDSTLNVTFTSTADSIVFNSRGLAVGLASAQTITLSANGKTRIVCVTRMGAIQSGSCVQ